MIKRISPVVLVLLCVFLDITFFARANILDMRPDAMLSATVSYGILMGPFAGSLLGALGGLLSDLLAGPALGLNAALYLMCGMAGGFFYRKFYADNVIIPGATAIVCGFMKELFLIFIRFVGGARFSLPDALIRYILPGAFFSGVFCVFIHVVLKPIVARQTKGMAVRE